MEKKTKNRKIILKEVLPVLPDVTKISPKEFFMFRVSFEKDLKINNKKLIVIDGFIAFRLGKTKGSGNFGSTLIVTENLKKAKLIGPLSQEPHENEVIVPENTTYDIIGDYSSYEDFYNKSNCLNETKEHLKYLKGLNRFIVIK